MNHKQQFVKVLGTFLIVTLAFGSSMVINTARLQAAPKQARVEAQAVGIVNVNTAGLEELQAVRGIGPSLAERIVQYRKNNGPFGRVEDLSLIRGIGEATLRRIEKQVAV